MTLVLKILKPTAHSISGYLLKTLNVPDSRLGTTDTELTKTWCLPLKSPQSAVWFEAGVLAFAL